MMNLGCAGSVTFLIGFCSDLCCTVICAFKVRSNFLGILRIMFFYHSTLLGFQGDCPKRFMKSLFYIWIVDSLLEISIKILDSYGLMKSFDNENGIGNVLIGGRVTFILDIFIE